MAWVYLFVAGLLEIAWAAGMKASEGFSKPWESVFTLVTMVASFALLAMAMRTIPLGTAYAVWTGIGAVGAVLVGIFWFGDPAGMARILCVVLIISGIIGLKLAH